MPTSTEDKVKLLCVKYKCSDSLGKVKLKLLRAMRKAERRNSSLNAITHPLQPWTSPCHTVAALPADDVLMTLSNSRYIIFLTRDGRVCRLRCSSRPELTQQKGDNSVASILNSLRRGSGAHGVSFQEESDAEYARQLQAEFEAESHRLLTGAPSDSPFFARASSPSAVLEELDREAHALMYAGMSSSLEPSSDLAGYLDNYDTPIMINSIWRDTGAAATVGDPRNGDSPPPDYRSLFGERRSSGGPPVQGGTLGAELGRANNQSQSSKGNVVWPEMGTLEWLVCKQNPETSSGDNRFVAMAVLHSEILLVSAETRKLYSWSCSESSSSSSRLPSLVQHPLTEELGLASEKVAILESSEVRATIVTETGKVATFYDALLRVSLEEDTPSLIQSLTHPAQTFSEFEGDSVVNLSVSNFITTAVTSSGKVFWWGLCPQDKESSASTSRNQGNQAEEERRQTGSSSRSRSRGTITDGSLVRLKNGPPCGPNSIVYSKSPYAPRVGKTMNIIEHGSLDPKTSVLVKVFKDEYRVTPDASSSKKKSRSDLDTSSRHLSDLDSSSNYNGLEVWKLSDVVFLDDFPAILGRVVTVDHPQAIVDISHSTNESGTLASSSNAKSTLKVFKVSELELCPIDYSETRAQQRKSNAAESSFSSSEAKFQGGVGRGGVSHHVAGTVQHHPVCILAPELSSHLQVGSVPTNLLTQQERQHQMGSNSSSSFGSIIYGYTPLAVHTSDEGPTMLVERTLDNSTFLVYSGHSSAGGLVSTSFVALNSKDSKPNRHTIEEESIPALEGGFKVDPVALEYSMSLCNKPSRSITEGSMVNTRSKVKVREPTVLAPSSSEVESHDSVDVAMKPNLPQRRSSRKRKLETPNIKSVSSSATNKTSESAPSSISNKQSSSTTAESPATSSAHQEQQGLPGSGLSLQPTPKIDSQLLLLRDVNGKICPLLDGLNLRPTHSKMDAALPTLSYSCIACKQYAISKSQSVLVVALVCKNQSLMPAVQSGNVMKVDAVLSSLRDMVQDQTSGKQKSKDSSSSECASHESGTSHAIVPSASETDVEELSSPAKRMKLSTPSTPSRELLDPSVRDQTKRKESNKSERLQSLSDVPTGMSFEVEIPVVEKSSLSENRSSGELEAVSIQERSDGGSAAGYCVTEKISSLGVLFETTVYNSNVLHVCCQLSESGAATSKDSMRKTTESTKQKLPSWLKSAPGMSELSFEEQRHKFIFSRKRERGRKNLKDLQAMSHSERKLAILEDFLSCDEIQPAVIKLLSSRNADGETPFMTSIHCQNYAAALKILESLEEWSIQQKSNKATTVSTSSSNSATTVESRLFTDAILSPSRHGATPIQALLASFSPFYDIQSMRLHVSNLPVNYTAQHLLKLFQLRYPSVYKAKILKGDRDDEKSGSSDEEEEEEDGWSSEEEDGEDESRAPRGEGNTISGLLRRSAARRRRNLRRSTNYTLTGGASSVHPRRGVVHFSNVKELRAAATEMKDYRMITSVSRSTGFGHTQSIHYLRVSLESSSDSDDDADSAERGLGTSGFNFDDFRPLPRFGHDSLRGNRRGNDAGGSRKKNNKGKAASMSKLSSPVLAYQLLQKLLTYHHLVVATDNAGETALSSLVHNSRCLQSLKELQKSLTSKDETENNSENRSHLSSRNRTPNSTATTFGLPRTSSGRPIRSFTTLAELMKSQEEETRSALNIDRYVPSSSTTNTSTGSTSLGVGLGAESGGTTVMPYVSLADWLDNFFTKLQGTPLEGSLPKILTETQQILQNSNSSSPGTGNIDDKSGSSATSTKDTDGDGQAPLSKLAHTSILATSTPKSSLASKSKTTNSSTKTPTPLKASSTASTEAKDAQTEEKMKEGGAKEKEVGGASPVALKIFKSTKPFVKTVSAKVDDEVGYSPAAAASDSDDESGTPESKRLRLTSPEPVSKMAESAKFTFTQSLGLKPSEGAKETSHVSGKLSAGEQHENEKQGNVDGGDVDIGEQILRALVTSWPCVVATVLGFYPSCVTKSSSTKTPSGGGILESKSSLQLGLSREETGAGGSSEYNFSSGLDFCSVHTLDSFTSSLVLNCEESTINILVASIIEKMNAAVLSSTRGDNEVDLTLLSESIDFTKPPEEVCDLNSHNVALLVGQRFMNSVVRLLGLEHSRVKNAFLEMQQMRQSNTGESRSRSERDGHTTHFPDTSNSFFDLDRSHSRRERRTTPTPRKNLTVAVKQILSQFSWLAVHSLSEAAEAASAPVRIGVSKPLGASSVLPEYQGASRSAYGSHAYTIPSNNNSLSSQWSLARQLHVRTPQSILTRKKKKVAQQSFSSLPADGIILRPCSKDHDDGGQCSGADRIGGGVASMIVGGASIHDESFEEEFSDMEGSVADGNADGPSTSGVTADHTTPTYFTELSLPPEITGEMFLDLDPSSSDDESIMEFPPGSVLHRTHGQGGTTEGDNIDDIYPFAWALDGRRIGENSDANNARPTSPSGATIFHSEPTVPLTSIPSIRFGAGFLARTFARFVKDLVDIAKDIADKKEPQTCLKLPPEIVKTLMNSTVVSMEKTWQWVTSVLDVAEGQLRQGQYFETQRHVVSLRSGSTRYHSSIRPGQVARVSRSFVGSTPGEYITYLLRTHAREDRECLPVLDLYGYEHVVYMLDGLIYTINNWPKAVVTTAVDQSDSSEPYVFESTNQVTASSEDSKMESLNMEVDDNSKSALGTESPCRFFKRTESVTVTMPNDTEIQRHNEQFFGSDGTATTLSLEQPEHAGPPTPWRSQDGRFSQPLNEAYPLAQRPHLLKPFAKKEHLFGTSVSSDTSSDVEKGEDRLNRPRLSVSYSNPIVSDLVAPITMNWSMEEVQQRWHSAISVFAHIFLAEGPGSERSNFLNAKAGFASRMARFRHLVQQLFDASQLTRDWAGTVSNTLSIRVRRDHLLLDSTDLLKQLVRFHYVNLRVKFDGEDGSGPGVNRGFFASLANELKSSDVTKQPMNKLGQFFCEPGKTPEQSGLFAPCPFSPSGLSLSAWHTVISQRKTVFQAIGRFLGLCLWFRYTIPFMVCRHVAKFFLGRELAWHDLAFYNADLYEGLRRMMLDAEEGKKDPEEFVATYCCYFEAPLCGQNSEPWLVELIPGGSKIPVTQQRVKEYVRLYAMFLMVECVKEELQAMKDGLNDIIPSELLSGLTAEDFQLLLSGGSADINVSKLKSVIRFNHTHGNSTTICDRFEKMFWRVVSHMTNSQRQQLLYFATGSATLPASSDTSARNPAVAITIDVISSSSIDSLPVASTCSQRMSIPLYPSYHLLKKKLLQAVQCQAYGLG